MRYWRDHSDHISRGRLGHWAVDKEVKMEIAMRRNPFQASLLDQARHGIATLAPALVAGNL